MIKVIASDMDGTLLNKNHEISQKTLEAIHRAEENNIEFIIATGRGYSDAMKILKKYDFKRYYIVASGADVRDSNGELRKKVLMDYSMIEAIYERVKKYPVAIRFCEDKYDYMIGKREDVEASMIEDINSFFKNDTEQDIADLLLDIMKRVKTIDVLSDLSDQHVPITKLFIFSSDIEMLQQIDQDILEVENIASASSLISNLEITHIEAQKGIALKEYIEALGYSMDEVMVLGDSMNDYSMLKMPFGATVAMGNAMDEIKSVSNYLTKPNYEDGVAYAINKMLDGDLEELRK